MVVQLLPHALHLCDHFLIFQSKVFDGLRPDTPSDHKNRITERCFSLVQTESEAAMINGKAATMELT
jgi:hypothetical protein